MIRESEEHEIIWLASYPKSGNTWLRFFLTSLIQGPPESSDAITDFIPEIPDTDAKQRFAKPGLRLVKTHLKYHHKTLPHHDKTLGFIYIVRNPLDVLMSNFSYHQLKLDSEPSQSPEDYFKSYFYRYIRDLGDPFWFQFHYGTWYENVISWMSEAAKTFPYLLIRYEDMLREPMVIARTICAFLNLHKSEQEIQTALDYSSFKNMKKIEEKELAGNSQGFFSREKTGIGYDQGRRFMNKGKVGRFATINPVMREQAIHVFQAPLKQFGYFNL